MTLGLLLAGALLPPLRRAIALLRIVLMLMDVTSTLAHEGIHGVIQGAIHGAIPSAMDSAVQRAIEPRAAAPPAIVTVSEPAPIPPLEPSRARGRPRRLGARRRSSRVGPTG